MAVHARLGPSAADRWWACPAAPRMAAMVPPAPSSAYAQEGTAAHSVLETALNKWHLDRADCASDEQYHALQIAFDAISLERQRYIEPHFFAVETRVHPCHRADLFGTADVVIAGTLIDGGTKSVSIADLKYGQHVIVAATTKQLAIYALGAAALVGMAHVDTFRTIVVQPRGKAKTIPKVRKHDYSLAEMLVFNRQMLEAAAATDLPDAPQVAGKHCMWCGAKDICAAHASASGSAKPNMADFDIFPMT